MENVMYMFERVVGNTMYIQEGESTMDTNIKTFTLQDLNNVPPEYFSISVPKLEITRSIKNAVGKQNITVRKLAEKAGMKHPQIVRVTSCENYTIDTLLKVLDALNLSIEIKEKS